MAVRSYQKSSDAFARAIDVIPGGVNSPARAFGAVGGTPVFVDHAEGAYIFDLDGHRYIDYIGSWGPMILGHANPKVLSAVQAAAEKGTKRMSTRATSTYFMVGNCWKTETARGISRNFFIREFCAPIFEHDKPLHCK